jgi:hypothetical protein
LTVRLELEGGTTIEHPTDGDIADALASLQQGDNSFAILGQTEMTYLQASGGDGDGFVLEYQDGSLVEHYHSIDRAIPLDRVIRTFQKYGRGDTSWRAETKWRTG